MGTRRILSESFCFRWLIGLRDNGGGFQPSIVRDVFTTDEVTIPSDDGGSASELTVTDGLDSQYARWRPCFLINIAHVTRDNVERVRRSRNCSTIRDLQSVRRALIVQSS